MKMHSKHPRIGIFVMSFPKPSETFIVTKVLGLLDAGFDVHIFTMSESADWDRFDKLRDRDDVHQRVHVSHPLRPKLNAFTVGALRLAMIGAKHPKDFMRFVFHCWRNRTTNPRGLFRSIYTRAHFVGHKLDLLHIEFDFQAGAIVDLKAFLNCKILLSSHGTFRRTGLIENGQRILEYSFAYMDAYHMISHYLLNDRRELGLPETIPYRIIEPAIDLDLFQPKNSEEKDSDTLVILSIGQLSWANGYEFAVDAIAIVRDAGIPLQYVILGQGNYGEPIQFAIHQHGLHDVVKLVGNVSCETMVDYLSQCDIFLHSALEEGFCNAALEAQAMGIPVITSDAGGLPEWVEDGVTGFVVPRRNPKAMAEKIIELARNHELKRSLGAAGSKRVAKQFDIRMQVEKFAQFYYDILELES